VVRPGVGVVTFVAQLGLGPGRHAARVVVLLEEVEAHLGAEVEPVDDAPGHLERLVVAALAADGRRALLKVGDGPGPHVWPDRGPDGEQNLAAAWRGRTTERINLPVAGRSRGRGQLIR